MHLKALIYLYFRGIIAGKWSNTAAAAAICSFTLTLAVLLAAQVCGGLSNTDGLLQVLADLSAGMLFVLLLLPCAIPVVLIVLNCGCGKVLNVYVAAFCLVALICIAYITIGALWL